MSLDTLTQIIASCSCHENSLQYIKLNNEVINPSVCLKISWLVTFLKLKKALKICTPKLIFLLLKSMEKNNGYGS
jgi:hypothetical protein